MNRDTSANPNPLKITKVVSEQIAPSRSSFLHIKKECFLLLTLKKKTKKNLQPESYGNPAVFCQHHFAPAITVFLTNLFFFLLFFCSGGIFPRLIQQINSAFWLLTKRKKGKKKIPSIFATHVLHHSIVAFSAFSIGCWRLCLAGANSRTKRPITASTSRLCAGVRGGEHAAAVINAALVAAN